MGPEPWGYHLVNLLIHITAALLLFGIVRRTLDLPQFRVRYEHRGIWLALTVALIWLVHPLQTESVTYLVQRAESLMGMLYLLTMYCAIRGFTSEKGTFWYLDWNAVITYQVRGKEDDTITVSSSRQRRTAFNGRF